MKHRDAQGNTPFLKIPVWWRPVRFSHPPVGSRVFLLSFYYTGRGTGREIVVGAGLDWRALARTRDTGCTPTCTAATGGESRHGKQR